jgi:hypothetical protein
MRTDRHLFLSLLLSLAATGGTLQALPADGQQTPAKDEAARTDFYGDPLPPGAVARFGTRRFYVPWHVTDLRYTADGSALVVTSCPDSRLVPYHEYLHLMDAGRGTERRREKKKALPGIAR